ncbi:MAG: T9SS type A sorting domain-containing protein [Ginsengibacter sp.]
MLQRILLYIFLGFACFQITEAQVTFTLPANPGPNNINYAEYFIDADPGFGSGTSIPITSSTDITANNYSVNISTVASGVHRIYFRTRDTKGIWSISNVQTFFKLYANANLPSNPAAANIVKVEYFVDTDPGFGKGISIPITSSNDVMVSNSPLDVSAYPTGVHHIYFRSLDAKGSWSETNEQTFFIANVAAQIPANPVAANIVKMEYFTDTDPGFGKGKPITITPSSDLTASNVAIDLTGLSNGVHRIYFRSQDANWSWSETNLQTFNILLANVVIPSNPIAGNITKFEYFFDKDPGFGNGKLISIASTTDLSNYTFVADLTGLKNDTTHTLYIRTFNNWSLTNTRTFIIGSTLPLTWISFNAKAINKNVELDWITAKEINTDHFDMERSSDGVHFSKIGTVPSSQNPSAESDYTFTDAQPMNGISYYRLKQVDRDGHYTYSIIISIKINTQLVVKIIGNPVHNTIHLEITGANGKAISVWITDASGRRYKNFTATDGSKQINIEDLSSGYYVLSYLSGDMIISIPFTKQ